MPIEKYEFYLKENENVISEKEKTKIKGQYIQDDIIVHLLKVCRNFTVVIKFKK